MAITGRMIRDTFLEKNTFGTLTLLDDGKPIFQCDTVEDVVLGNGDPKTVEEWKKPGDSAIPYGRYTCALTSSGRFSTYNYDGKKWEIMNVPFYKGIRIHTGYDFSWTEGCVILGKRNKSLTRLEGHKTDSAAAKLHKTGLGHSQGPNDSDMIVYKFERLLEGYGNPKFILEITSGSQVRRSFSGIKLGDYLFREQMTCYDNKTGHDCGFKTVDYLLAVVFNKLAKELDHNRIAVNSGSRCETMNGGEIGGIGTSYHLVGQAMDIFHDDMDSTNLMKAITQMFGNGVNCVKLDDDRVHIDVRSPRVDKKQIPVGPFTRADFNCSCGCGLDSVDYTVVRVLAAIREEVTRPIQIVPTKKCATSRNGIGMYADFTVPKIPGKGLLAKGEPAMSASEIIGQFGGKFTSVAKMEKISDFVVRIIAI